MEENKKIRDENIISHQPGSLQHLEDGNPNLTPIDSLLYYYDYHEGNLELAKFRYKGVWYIIWGPECNDEDVFSLTLSQDPENKHIVESDTFVGLLDSPFQEDGTTVRQAWTQISFDDFQII